MNLPELDVEIVYAESGRLHQAVISEKDTGRPVGHLPLMHLSLDQEGSGPIGKVALVVGTHRVRFGWRPEGIDA